MQRLLPTSIPPHPSSLATLVLILSFTTTSSTPNQSPITDDLVTFILTSIYQDQHPASFTEWLISCARDLGTTTTGRKLLVELEETILRLLTGGLDSFHGWLNDLKSLYPSSEDDEVSLTPTPLHRTSPLSLYIRRTRLSFSKMSFERTVDWWNEVRQWSGLAALASSASSSSTATPPAGAWDEGRGGNGRRIAERYLKSKAQLDYQAARDGLGYYDLDDGSINQTKPQYALLNLAFLEYEMGGIREARRALKEAVQVSRRAGDGRSLITCYSLAQRLQGTWGLDDEGGPGEGEGEELIVGKGRPTPTDVLWAVKRDLAVGEPTPTLYTLLLSSRSMFHSPATASSINGTSPSKDKEKESNNSNNKGRFATWNDAPWDASWNAVSGYVWDELGSKTLSRWREQMTLEVIDNGIHMWHVRLPVVSRRVVLLTKSAKYTQALQLLFRAIDTPTKRLGFGLIEFRAWEGLVWGVWRTRAERRGQRELVNHLDKFTPPTPVNWTRGTGEALDGDQEAVKLLRKGDLLLSQSQPTASLPSLLHSLHLSTQLHYPIIRIKALLSLFEAKLEFSPTATEAERSRVELEGIWGEVRSFGEVGAGEEEVLARARVVRGRLGVVRALGIGGTNETQDLVDATEDFCAAVEVYTRLGEISSALRVLALVCRVYDHLSVPSPLFSASSPSPLGSPPPPLPPSTSSTEEFRTLRDRTAREYLETQRRWEQGKVVGREDWAELAEMEAIVRAVERVVCVAAAVK